MTATVQLSSVEDLLGILPYHFGFHPRRSLVSVAVCRSRLVLVQRLDLPAVGDQAEAATAHMAEMADRADADAVLLIGYEDRAGEAHAPLALLKDRCLLSGLDVVGWLVVRDGRWYGEGPRWSSPPEGRPVPAADQVPAAAEWVALGVAPLPDRETLARSLQPDPGSAARRVAPSATADLSRRRQLRPRDLWAAAQVWRQLLRPDTRGEPCVALDDAVLATALAALEDVTFRDAVIAWLAPELCPPGLLSARVWRMVRLVWGPGPGMDSSIRPRAGQAVDEGGIQQRLIELCRYVDGPDCAAPLCILAASAWSQGNGALAAVALERAAAAAPGHTLTRLLTQLVRHGIRPGTVGA